MSERAGWISYLKITLIALVLGVAACAAPPDGGTAPSGTADVGAGAPQSEELTSDEAAALAALESHEQDTYYLFTAQGTMMQKCLEARGITAYPTSLVTDPLRVMAGSVGTPEAYSLWYAGGKPRTRPS